VISQKPITNILKEPKMLAIHQPEHMPWLGFFDKMNLAEKFIILDDVQYRKNYFQNRNRIAGSDGEPKWISVSTNKGSLNEKINEKKILKNSYIFPKKYKNLIYESYKNEAYFSVYSEELFELIDDCGESLFEFNMDLIYFFRDKFNIDTQIFFSSDLNYEGKKSDLISSLCKKMSASTYLSGPSGKDYLDFELFENSNINLEFHEFIQQPYLSSNYHPNLSSLDYLFRLGPNYFNKK